MPRRKYRPVSMSAFFVFTFACLSYGPSTRAGEFTVFTKTYVRAAGTPVTVEDAFDVRNANTTWVLRAVNGNLEDDTVERVSSSFLTLNGVEILQANDFNQTVGFLEVSVNVLPSNTIAVQLRSKPGGQLTVHIIGRDDSAPVIADLLPADGVTLDDPRAAISANYADAISGIDLSSARLILDGADVTADAQVTETSLSFTRLSHP